MVSMSMINVFLNLLQDGMEVRDVKETVKEYKIVLDYNGMRAICGLIKTCAPSHEEAVCKSSINSAIAGMYIKANNPEEAQAWLDGKRWDIKPKPLHLYFVHDDNVGIKIAVSASDDASAVRKVKDWLVETNQVGSCWQEVHLITDLCDNDEVF